MTWANYANTGPFTNNVTPPGLSATFVNNIESFLDQIISSAAGDANITANGSGALTAVSATFSGSGTGLTVSHNATVGGALTTTGNHIANGGMNTNTIRDNSSNTAIDLSAGAGQAKFPVGVTAVLKSIGGGHTLTDWNAGFQAVVTTGTVITHGLKNASGVATTPTAIVITPTLQTTFLVNAQGTTTFNVNVGSNCNVFWLAILL